MSFNNLGLSPWMLKLAAKISYKVPTPIQSMVIKPISEGKSVIANAETGSGKTAAFAFPLLDRLSKDPYAIFAIIITPSRELAVQIYEQLLVFGQPMNLRVSLLIGGVNYIKQCGELNSIPHFIVGTPGRINDLIVQNDTFSKYAKNCQVLVLDEADRLFQQTLLIPMQGIIQKLPRLNQVILATATIDNNFQGKKLKQLLRKEELTFEKYSTYQKATTVDTLIQKYLFIPELIKTGYLYSVIQKNPRTKMIIFVRTCRECELIHTTLKKLELPSCLLHSFMKQTRRSANISIFRNQKADILVTTDLASRGLDIKAVDLVINYDIPRKVSDYIHRVGRTARKGMEGTSITFVTQNQVALFQQIQKSIGVKMDEEVSTKEEEAIDGMRIFNKAMREAKMQLSSSGVMEQIEKKQEKKRQMKMELKQRRLAQDQGQQEQA